MSGSRTKLKSLRDQILSDCANYILDEFEESKGARVTYAAEAECSIKFSEPKLGTLRIASTEVNPTYICRWNIYTGDNVPTQGKYKSHWYAIEEAHKFVERLTQYHDTIQANTANTSHVGSAASYLGHTEQEVPTDIYAQYDTGSDE